jgi:hypothetical protein
MASRIPYSPRHKRTRAERKRDLADVATLHVAGSTQQEIADWISRHRPYKLDRSQIAYDLKELQSQWQQKSTKTIQRAVLLEVVRINQIECLAWECWDRSIGEVVRVRHRKIASPRKGSPAQQSVREVVIIQKSISHGDTRYMKIIQWCVDQRCKILGLYADRTHQRGKAHFHTKDGLESGGNQCDMARVRKFLKDYCAIELSAEEEASTPSRLTAA